MGACEGYQASSSKGKLCFAVQALCLLASLQSAASIDGPKDYRQKFKVGREDFVISMPVDQKHLTVAKGSRAWRQVITNQNPFVISTAFKYRSVRNTPGVRPYSNT